MENPSRNYNKNNIAKDSRGFTLIEIMITTTLFVMIVTATVMIFFQTFKSTSVISYEQGEINQLISLQLVKPSIRQGKILEINDGGLKMHVIKWNSETVDIYLEENKVLMNEYDQQGDLTSKRILVDNAKELSIIPNGPCSITMKVTTEKMEEYSISEYCR